MAPAPGVEPGTHGLTVRCYYLLSYAGVYMVMVPHPEFESGLYWF